MSGLKLAAFAKDINPSDSIQREGSEDDDVEMVEPKPSGSSMEPRQVPSADFSHLPKIENNSYYTGPVGSDGSIQVRYRSQIDGYNTNVNELQTMENVGLPTGFSFSSTYREKTKKGDKKTFYCDVCLIELNSEDTMKSHISGVKHQKKAAVQTQNAEMRGEKFLAVRPIPNPEPTKRKVPIRLHEKIKEAKDPVIGLAHVVEYIAVSDSEMDPHYECNLCGSKGIANGMFSHIMGHKHRQQVMMTDNPNDERYLDRSQKECLRYAAKNAENNLKLSEAIKSIRSDEEYPWPPGKAPWSIEQGGTGVAPERAKENAGKNNHFEPKASAVSIKQEAGGLPGPEGLREPRTREDAERYFLLAERLLQLATDGLAGDSGVRMRNLTKVFVQSVRRQNGFVAAAPAPGTLGVQSTSLAGLVNSRVKREQDSSFPGPSTSRMSQKKRSRDFQNSRSPSPQRARRLSPRGGSPRGARGGSPQWRGSRGSPPRGSSRYSPERRPSSRGSRDYRNSRSPPPPLASSYRSPSPPRSYRESPPPRSYRHSRELSPTPSRGSSRLSPYRGGRSPRRSSRSPRSYSKGRSPYRR